jgi:hypothetical protein
MVFLLNDGVVYVTQSVAITERINHNVTQSGALAERTCPPKAESLLWYG